MPRIARKDIKTPFIHVMVQGVNKEYIFDDKNFLNYYLQMIKKYIQQNDFELLAYCMMDNHAHFLFYVEEVNSFEKYMKKINQKFALLYNKKKNRVGVVFRNRYQIEPVYDINHLKNCIKYIHDNPVKANMVEKCEDYYYSSYKEYKQKNGVANSKIIKQIFGEDCDYLRVFDNSYKRKFLDCEANNEIKEYILAGIAKFEKEMNYNLLIILSEKQVLKRMFVYLKEECSIQYKETAKFLNLSKSFLNNIKKE